MLEHSRGPAAELPTIKLDNIAFYRLVKAHHPEGLGVGWGQSRFVPDPETLDLKDRFRAIYAAEDLTTAFCEAVLRDRAVLHAGKFPISLKELSHWDVVSIRSQDLKAVDTTGLGMLQLRIPSDAIRAQSHSDGQAFGLRLHQDPNHFPGIHFSSRLTERRNIMVFERAISECLRGEGRTPLVKFPGFADVLDALKIEIA